MWVFEMRLVRRQDTIGEHRPYGRSLVVLSGRVARSFLIDDGLSSHNHRNSDLGSQIPTFSLYLKRNLSRRSLLLLTTSISPSLVSSATATTRRRTPPSLIAFSLTSASAPMSSFPTSPTTSAPTPTPLLSTAVHIL